MNNYRFTILMPNYNQEKYIAKSIDSILAQRTNFGYQIIIIDDASTDDSLKIAKEYQRKYSDKIKIIPNEHNLKLAKTILKGYENLKTDYFCVLDPDDYWIKDDRLQKAVDFFDKNPDFSIYATNTILLKNGQESGVYVDYKGQSHISTFDNLLDDKAVLSCTQGSVYRNTVFKNGVPKEFYDKIGTISEDSFRGDSFRNYLHLSTGKAYFINEVDSVYRINNEGIWTSLSTVNQYIFGAYFYVDMYEFFMSDVNSYKLLLNSYKLYKNIILEINNIMRVGENYSENILLTLNVDKLQYLLNIYKKNREILETQDNPNNILKCLVKLLYYNLPIFKTSYSKEKSKKWLDKMIITIE